MASREVKQNGSIRKRKDGRWEVRVTNGIDYATGKTVRILLRCSPCCGW